MSHEPMKGAFENAQPINAPLTYKPAQRRDESALVREHLPLVKKLAWHVHGSMSTAVEVEDLVQVGLVALVEAVAGFEDRGLVTFRQYLATRVRGAMIDELRRHAAMTRGAIRRRKDYNRALSALNAALGRTPTEREIAGHLGVTLDKLRQDYATAEAVRFEPIDDVYTDDAPWFASGEPDAFDQLAESEQRDLLIAAIAKLPEREALVIQLYHVEELNLEEIGQVLGIGAARVCQIKSAAHARLKKAMLAR
ncbi:RNA polymerase subunit sigma-70 [Sphingomonas sp. EC-HK361]|uniref:sigma-70 family RNA polymerase sigma factor n=1 Tax=Sphingomonas sp. EC-HK361 TaxID=2038397 RepID=UPI001255AA45|nr:FliA/WhiG family RNA polymerase sigma factor [Sphingomonas sp. EC-HK361]VVT06768.1 RNA polymerase subunit sigma-70 [Sphingomonas sp. EC-HK361]